jgi:hypothetical protein
LYLLKHDAIRHFRPSGRPWSPARQTNGPITSGSRRRWTRPSKKRGGFIND